MGIKISKKKFLNYLKISDELGDGEDRNLKLHAKRSGLSEREIFYIWKHYGKLYVTYVEDGEYGENEK